MEQSLVSVIVPVYNAESYLVKCVSSICGQTYKNLQIILVNDGSRDLSLQICRMFEQLDSRVLVIDKQNTGVSDTRNVGLSRAEGKYIQFADSDDYLAPEATELFVSAAETTRADMIISPYLRVNGTRKKFHNLIEEESTIDRTSFVCKLMDKPASFYYGVVWNKIYRADLIRKHEIQFCRELRWSEDLLFNLEYIQFCNSFHAIQRPTYYYVRSESNLLSVPKLPLAEIIETRQNVYLTYKKIFENLGIYEKNKIKVFKYCISVSEIN